MVQPVSDGAFQGRVDLGQQAVDPVGGPGDLTGQVVIEPDNHLQICQGVRRSCRPAAACAASSGLYQR